MHAILSIFNSEDITKKSNQSRKRKKKCFGLELRIKKHKVKMFEKINERILEKFGFEKDKERYSLLIEQKWLIF